MRSDFRRFIPTLLVVAACSSSTDSGPKGALDIAVSGLPSGPAAIMVTGPNSYSHTVTATTTLSGLEPGAYTVTATNVVVSGTATYAPAPAVTGVSITTTTLTAPVAYSLASGSLALTVSGLPSGVNANVAVTGPGGFSQVATASQTWTNLTPGSYVVTPGVVTNGANTYGAAPATQTIVVPASLTAATANEVYSLAGGQLTVTVSGLPAGTNPSIVVTGPLAYSHPITVSGVTVLSGLVLGTYTITASNASNGTATYGPATAVQTVTLSAGTPNGSTTVTYSLKTGSLALTVSGLPGGVNASVLVTGPGSFSQTATASQTFNNLTPGTYTVTANTVTSGSNTYGGTPPSQTVTVTASLTAATASEVYSLMTGQITVTIAGLPGGLNPSVLVTGPFSYSHPITVSGATVLTLLPLGTYTITASAVSNATAIYTPAVASQTVTLSAGSLSGAKTVTYAISTGSLTVTMSGLPVGPNDSVRVTGPGAFKQWLPATTTLNKLTPGKYTVFAFSVLSGGTWYAATPGTQIINVVASAVPATASVTYSVAALNLTIDGMYLTQSTQSYNDTVPLVANRPGYLRVFVKANQSNNAMPAVRVRWYSGASLVRTDTIAAPRPYVPTLESEDSAVLSWNLPVPQALIQANLRVIADVDPANLIAETNEADNTFPTSGTPFAFNVIAASIFHEMLIPVKTFKDGLVGNVTSGNASTFMAFTQKVHPIPSYQVQVHAVFTDSTVILQSDGTGWGTILNEISVLRAAEVKTVAQESLYYYGVVHPNYGGGVAGLGYVGCCQAAIGWDRGQNDQILAHETGHNWGLDHAPGCGAAGADPSYPNATGNLDAYGVDVVGATPTVASIYTPAANFDLMSYCRPYWISNYHYIHVMNFRSSSPDIFAPAAAAGGTERVLLVWGRVEHGQLVLEPAFEIDALPSTPSGRGSLSIEGLDAGGGALFSHSFEAAEMGDDPQGTRGFVFKIPVRNFDVARLSSLRLRGPGAEVRVEGGAAVAAMNGGSAPVSRLKAELRGGVAHVSWDHTTYPMAMVRDRRTGQVLSFARGGSVDVPSGDLVVVLSNGVRSVTETVKAQ